ncbi:AraC family transcriptional regulator [Butyrivibrio sp. AE3004]|uniref:AraC family transcriptional regulator n=1 Tax=Butyrivibrio sp. AE3004 TaxID=1506994 RepID=UPI000689C243|nr:AraC family transcriptional regulator [Butyrivibrio sp. AE3004]
MHYTFRINQRQYRKTPLILRNLGTDYNQDDIDRPKGFPIWQILYGVSGSGKFSFGSTRGVLQPGQIILLYPGEAHSYRSMEGDWYVHFLGFDGSLCKELLFTLGMTRSGIYSLSSPDKFLRHVSALEELMSQRKPGCLTECSKELYALLLDLVESMTLLPDYLLTESTSLGREMILYLEDHFAEDISLDELSKQFGRTPEYLSSFFKESTGETVMKYLRRIRIHHAQVLLMTSPDTGLSDIAKACGFNSSSYFCKVFRETLGMTPQSFRMGITERGCRTNLV